MTQPTAYNPATNFSQEEVSQVSGRSTVRTTAVDAELAALALTLSEVLANMAALQRDDLKLIDRSVELHTLSTEVLALMGSAGFTINDPIGWLTATAYAARSIVTEGTGTYVAVSGHTSGVFATDLAAGKWVLIFDSVNYVAGAVAFTPTGGISATDVQAAIAEVDAEAPKKAGNLSDLASAVTARANLSVASLAEIQQNSQRFAIAGGAVDVITGSYTPAISSYSNGTMLIFEALGANATSTPTFNANGVGAKTIVRPDGGPLYVGDIPAANYRAIVFYDSGLDVWILLNPFHAGPNPGAAGHLLTSQGPGVKPAWVAPATASRIGEMVVWPGITLPSNAFECDGTAYSRTTYADLFAKLVKSATATISIASPGVVTWAAHGLLNNMPIKFSTTGTLPTGIVAGVTYWIVNKATDTFEVAATPGGTSINTSGTQSGVHTAICAPHGDGDSSTTFNVPNLIDRMPIGYGTGTIVESFLPAAVDAGTDAIAVEGNNARWVTGSAVVLSTTGTLPAGLSPGTYYVVRTGAQEIKLASSLANAQNGTVVNITDQGTGTHTMTHTRPTRGLGEAGGEDAHAMSLSELLGHAHTSGGGTGYTLGATDPRNQAGTSVATSSVGGNTAMNNMSPFIGERWIIYHSA